MLRFWLPTAALRIPGPLAIRTGAAYLLFILSFHLCCLFFPLYVILLYSKSIPLILPRACRLWLSFALAQSLCSLSNSVAFACSANAITCVFCTRIYTSNKYSLSLSHRFLYLVLHTKPYRTIPYHARPAPRYATLLPRKY